MFDLNLSRSPRIMQIVRLMVEHRFPKVIGGRDRVHVADPLPSARDPRPRFVHRVDDPPVAEQGRTTLFFLRECLARFAYKTLRMADAAQRHRDVEHQRIGRPPFKA